MTDRHAGLPLALLIRTCATLVCALLIYYGLPLRMRGVSDLVGMVLFVTGFAGLMWLIVRQARRYVARPSDATERLMTVLTILYVVVVFFALSYYLIERNAPEQFAVASAQLVDRLRAQSGRTTSWR